MEDEQAVLFEPVSLHYFTVIGLDLGMKLREACKVLIIKEKLCCFVHLFDIERSVNIEGVVGVERILVRVT